MAYEEEVLFKFNKGHKVSYKLFSDGISESGLVIILPAMGVRGSYYKRLARCIVEEKEKDVITLDYRGMGTSTVRADRRNKIGYQAMINDLYEIVNSIIDDKSYNQIELCGHSLGGQVACMFGARYSDCINHIILIGSSLPYYKDWPGKRRHWLKFAGKFFVPLSQLIGYFPGQKFGFAGREGIQTMKDWCHLVNTGRLEPMGSSFNYNSAIEKYTGKVRAFSFTEDEMTPSETVSQLVNKFKSSASVSHHIIEGFNHFNWSKSPLHIVKHIP
ncbi:MAG: alpha/beta fold hydrolase [Saprospiraceae bacterium]|nr:alpha/beta fold hydrolase [Saprospiraceae bacterium]